MLAGVLGNGVAEKLHPFGADHPDTETVQAAERLKAAGHREVGLVVLLPDVRPGAKSNARRARAAHPPRPDRDVAAVAGYSAPGDRDFVSRDRTGVYMAVALKPVDDRARHDAGERIAADLGQHAGRARGGAGARRDAGQRAGGG